VSKLMALMKADVRKKNKGASSTVAAKKQKTKRH